MTTTAQKISILRELTHSRTFMNIFRYIDVKYSFALCVHNIQHYPRPILDRMSPIPGRIGKNNKGAEAPLVTVDVGCAVFRP